MIKNILLILGLLGFTGLAFAENTDAIQRVNRHVAELEKAKAALNTLELKVEVGEFESVPPRILFYYNPENTELQLAEIDVGHEIFSTSFRYYFDDGRIIKYLKYHEGHPDKPAKQAIIYSRDGSVLWRNIDQPTVSIEQVVTLFEKNMATLIDFAKY
jgi:hypothetical protein